MGFECSIRGTAMVCAAAALLLSVTSAGAATRVTIATWNADPNAPLPAAHAAPPLPASAILARDLHLGPDWRDPNRLTLWWYGVSSFVASLKGHVFLLDAWEIVGLHKNYAPIGREELAALHPEAIFIGHGHFDHAADAGYVASRSGAVVVGSEEICGTAEADAARNPDAVAFTCLITGTATTPPPGTMQAVKVWADLPEVHVLQHLHSASRPQDPENPTFWPVPNLLPFVVHPNTDPEELLLFLSSAGDAQGGTWAYHFRLGELGFLWHDSAGPITANEPGGPEVQAALDSFPGCVDVQSGAILGFDQPFSGLRDPRLYVEHAHPRVFLPNHHDVWAPAIAAGAAAYQDEWNREMEKLDHPPVVRFLRDPEDYLKPLSFDATDPQWATPMPGSSCAAAAP